MLSGLLNALGSLLGSVVDLLGGLLGGLTQALAPPDPVASAVPDDAAMAAANTQVATVIDSTSEEANSLLDAAISGADDLVETGLIDSAHALSDLAQGLSGLTTTTVTTNYRTDGSISSVVEEVSHAPGAALMMHYVSEVLAPQVSGVGEGVNQFMQQTGAGMESALANLTDFDLSYSTTSFGTSLLVIDHA
ncbi:MAG: hypothetical protein PHR30_01365 [Gallionellaceae bacterium]|nr:hypothetical protein [Gallionellaceae bacterium]